MKRFIFFIWHYIKHYFMLRLYYVCLPNLPISDCIFTDTTEFKALSELARFVYSSFISLLICFAQSSILLLFVGENHYCSYYIFGICVDHSILICLHCLSGVLRLLWRYLYLCVYTELHCASLLFPFITYHLILSS